MADLYEIQISASTDNASYYVDHRSAGYPDMELVLFLKLEAANIFGRLYGTEPEKMSVALVRRNVKEQPLAPEPVQTT